MHFCVYFFGWRNWGNEAKMTNSWHASFPPCRMSKTKVVPYLSKSGSTFAFFFWLILLVAPPPFFIGIWKARTRTKSPLLCKTVNHIRFQSSWSLFYKEESPYCHNIDLSWSSAYHAVLLVNSFWPKFRSLCANIRISRLNCIIIAGPTCPELFQERESFQLVGLLLWLLRPPPLHQN